MAAAYIAGIGHFWYQTCQSSGRIILDPHTATNAVLYSAHKEMYTAIKIESSPAPNNISAIHTCTALVMRYSLVAIHRIADMTISRIFMFSIGTKRSVAPSIAFSMLPVKNSEYGTFAYWEARYANTTDSFDWFKPVPLSILTFPKSSKIIHLGCGNSELGHFLYQNGWTNICNVDYSPSVISLMKTRYPLMEWIVADIFDLSSFLSFDVAIDKGTLDALLTDPYDQWDPEPQVRDKILRYTTQVYNSLKDGGLFLHITFAQPHFRKLFLHQFDVTVRVITDNDSSFEYFCYECRKSSH
jgi:SAM-dependent methyltransferase